MKLKLFITHTFIFIFGMVVMLGIFVFSVMPKMYKYMPFPDTPHIKLAEKEEPMLYLRVLEDRFKAHLYLSSPFYFFAREKGFEVNKNLAQQGYWPSLRSLFIYHASRSDHPDYSAEEHETHYQEALKLAKFASERGYQIPMLQMIAFYGLANRQDVTTELALAEKMVEKTTNSGHAKMLAKYYAEAGNQEKSEYYSAIEQKIAQEKPPAPACSTITPWIGW